VELCVAKWSEHPTPFYLSKKRVRRFYLHCCGKQTHAFGVKRLSCPAAVLLTQDPSCQECEVFQGGCRVPSVHDSARHAMQCSVPGSSVGIRSRCFELRVLHLVSLYVLQ
jgi:hypothetical protein